MVVASGRQMTRVSYWSAHIHLLLKIADYDRIIFDSAPVLATDDTACLAPKIDATLFVVRLSYTSARLTRKSLELLYNRQVNVPGVILNYVDTSLPEYYYYQYSEYYNTPMAGEEHDVAAAHRHPQPKQIQSS